MAAEHYNLTWVPAEGLVIRTQAGFADLELTGEAYLHEFGLPNLYFHQAMAHVAYTNREAWPTPR